MLLPGPEAQKLATYIGWLLHGVRGGLTAGILFVLPGALFMLGLSLLYALGRGFSLVDGALFGIKAAVLVIVVEALIRIGKRALKTSLLMALALARLHRHFLFGAALSADRRGRGADRLSGRTRLARAPGRESQCRGLTPPAPGPLAAGHHRRHRRARGLGRADRARADRARAQPCAGQHRRILFQARGGELRRRLCRCSPTWRSRRSRPITG